MQRHSRLVDKTWQLLKDDTRILPVIYKECGIPYYWLQNFSSGKMKNPSAYNVETLYVFLSGKELDV